MPTVDDGVRAGVAAGKTISVIVGCGDNCASVAEDLRKKSIDVDDRAIEMGSLRAVVDAAKLRTVETTNGVDFIELDEDVSIL